MTYDFASNDVLLGIDEICKKLSISRSTFERRLWRSSDKPLSSIDKSMTMMVGNEFAGAPTFPKPDTMIGKSPRWAATTLNAWLNQK